MSKKKPCGLDYCPQEEIVGAYASCTTCAWGNDNGEESAFSVVSKVNNDEWIEEFSDDGWKWVKDEL